MHTKEKPTFTSTKTLRLNWGTATKVQQRCQKTHSSTSRHPSETAENGERHNNCQDYSNKILRRVGGAEQERLLSEAKHDWPRHHMDRWLLCSRSCICPQISLESDSVPPDFSGVRFCAPRFLWSQILCPKISLESDSVRQDFSGVRFCAPRSLQHQIPCPEISPESNSV